MCVRRPCGTGTPTEAGYAAPPTGIIVDDAFVPITVVPAQRLPARPARTWPDALQYKPGITGSTFAPGANRPVIRGLDNYRVRVQENGIGSHDVSALSEDHAVPIDPFAADRIEVVRGPATLRYGSQAIGGVVNAINDRIPEIIPPRGFSVETKGGLDVGGRRRRRRLQGHRRGRQLRGARRRLPAPRRRLRHARRAASSTPSSTATASRSARRSSATTASSASPISRFNSLYGIPGEDAVDEKTRIDMQQDKVQSRGEWRVRDHGIEAIRFWFGVVDYAHNEIGFEAGPPEIGSRFTNREQEGRVEVQHLPVMTRLGELTRRRRRAVRAAQAGGVSFEGEFAARSGAAPTASPPSGSRSCRSRSSCACRLRPASSRPRSTGSGLQLTAPDAGTEVAAERTFTPVSASAGILYELPLGVVARLTGQYVERAPADAELFSKGVHEATGTFEIGNPFLDKEKARTVELGLQEGQGPVPLRCLGLLHRVRRLHLQAAHRRAVRRHARHLRHRRRS